MKNRFTVWVLLASLVASPIVLPARSAEAQTTNPAVNRLIVPVSGTVAGQVVGTVTGTFAISRFVQQNGQLLAVGTLTAGIVDTAGNIVQTIIRQATLAVTNVNGTCEILHLELGPLDLTLLGLIIHLDRIVLDITAQAGAGLLGDLLCAIAGLLDANTLGQQLVNLLNQLLGALSRL